MDAIIEAMHRTHGLDVSCYESTFLSKSVNKRLHSARGETQEAYIERLCEDNTEAEAFYRSLRIIYSEFFRDPLAFALLEQSILPSLIDDVAQTGRSELRVWSAGCAGGQEAYSVAILLEELTARQNQPISYRIFATDLSETDLALARTGVYSSVALGNVRLRHLKEHFSGQGEAYVVAAQLRERIDFTVHDLIGEGANCPPASIYGDFDLVLCSNVLLYYRFEIQRLILENLNRSLAPGGYLVTGDTEGHTVESAGGFRAVAQPISIFRSLAGMR